MFRKQQWIAVAASAALVFGLFVFGKFTPGHEDHEGHDHSKEKTAPKEFDVDLYMGELKKTMTPTQSAYLTSLEDALTRGDLVTQRKANFQAMSNFWRDSMRSFIPYVYYLGEKAKLENSEKNLNFAAHSLLEELRGVTDQRIKTWMANQANDLFTRSLKINPNNDSSIVGQGSTFFFGASGAPMEGIMKIRAVSEKDPNNVFAQFMLGYGGMVSGQNEKAIERFKKVVELDPDNKEAVFLLAELYERTGDKQQAKVWYQEGLKNISNPELIKALEDKINSLK